MKTTFKKNIAALTAFALFAPWVNAQTIYDTDTQDIQILLNQATGLVNQVDIDQNENDINQNENDITSIFIGTNINTLDILSNDTDITTNATNIGTNDTDIAQNATDIGTAVGFIGLNTTDILTNDIDIAQNATDIGTNDTDIAQNATDIGTNDTDIAQNATDIARIDSYDTHAQNVTDLGNLAIGDIPTDISNVVTDIAAYRAVEDGIKTNLDTAISTSNNNIGITQAAIDDAQDLADVAQQAIITALIGDPLADVTALEAVKAGHDIDVANGNTLIASQQTQLSAEEVLLAESEVKIALYDSALNPNIDPANGPVGPIAFAQDAAAQAAVDIAQAVVDYTGVNSSAAGLEGIIAEIDNVTAGDQTNVTDAIVIANTDFGAIGAANASVQEIQALVGVINTQLPLLPAISQADKDVAIQQVTDGAYERVAIADNAAQNTATQADVAQNEQDSDDADAALAAADATNAAASAAADALIQADVAQNEQDSDDADAALAAADALIQADVNLNEQDSDDADVALAAADAANAAASAAADALIQADVNQNEQDSDDADAALAAADAANAAASAAADALIQADVNLNEQDSDDADAAITAAYTAADAANAAADALTATAIRDEFAIADAGITAAFTAADANLQSQVDINRADIDRNARGIAMVAALQHTTVLPGMTHALDLSAARFEGETGLALNYARRINENVQINFGAAATSDFDESVIKAGIGVQW